MPALDSFEKRPPDTGRLVGNSSTTGIVKELLVTRDNRQGARKAHISGLTDRGEVRFPIRLRIGHRHYD